MYVKHCAEFDTILRVPVRIRRGAFRCSCNAGIIVICSRVTFVSNLIVMYTAIVHAYMYECTREIFTCRKSVTHKQRIDDCLCIDRNAGLQSFTHSFHS